MKQNKQNRNNKNKYKRDRGIRITLDISMEDIKELTNMLLKSNEEKIRKYYEQ